MMEWTRADYTVTCDPARMDQDVIAGFLATSYWAPGIPAATVGKAVANSLCFALLQGLRRWMLATRDAHGLYERFGFRPLKNPSCFMERHDPDIYTRGA